MLGWTGSASEVAVRPAIDTARLLRIGTSGDYPPFSEAIDELPGYRGFDIAVATAFAKDRGYEIAWVRFRWPVLAAGLSTDRFDLAMSGVTVRSDRSALGRFSVPVMNSGAVVLYQGTAVDDPSTLASASVAKAVSHFDRPEMKIAVNRGGHLERVARAAFKHAQLRAIPDNASVRDALAKREVDAVVTDTLEAPVWRRGLGFVEQFGPLTRDRKAYWLAPHREALARELDAWLLARERDGTLGRLRLEYTGVAGMESTALPAAALVAAIDERLALMEWVAESKRVAGRAALDAAQEVRVLTAAVNAVSAAAERAGVEPPPDAAVRAFYRAQIEAAKAIQRRTLAGPPARDAEASDLDSVLRPALMRIGDRMAQLVVELHRSDGDVTGKTAVKIDVDAALESHALESDRLDEIRRAIAELAGSN